MDAWPALPLADWKDTFETLHMWTQVVGKVKLASTPLVNHFWNCALYVTPRGLNTGAMYRGPRTFELEFDFLAQQLRLSIDTAEHGAVALRPVSVAQFYRETMALLHRQGLDVRIWPVPVEVPDPVPFADDLRAAYDGAAAERCWRVLEQSARVLTDFRAEFIGKCSPVHFFWGSFDLAVTRFNGALAPERPGADAITREAYSHAASSVGWWPGGNGLDASFYSYMAPAPTGFESARVAPAAAYWHAELGEFLLPYDAVRTAADPDAALLDFCRSTYAAGADLAGWDRAALERPRS